MRPAHNHALRGQSVNEALQPAQLSPLQRLEEMGFRKCGEWRMDAGCIKCGLTDHASASNVLYAFVSAGTVLYIGKTVRTLKQRMYNYQRPGPTQSTSIRGNKMIRRLMGEGETIEIYALPDNGLLHYGGFHVNLAAGLEDALISTLKPVWNKAGL